MHAGHCCSLLGAPTPDIPARPACLPARLPAALKERIARLLAAVLPVATSGKEKKGGVQAAGGGGTTISIRSRPSDQEQQQQNGSKPAGERWFGAAGCCLSLRRKPYATGHPVCLHKVPQHKDIRHTSHRKTSLPPSLPSHPAAGAVIVVELLPDPAAPAAAAYPNTLPAAAALFGTAVATRYGPFLEQLQSAAWQEDDAAAAGGAGSSEAAAAAAAGGQDPAAASGSLPSLLQLTSILAGAFAALSRGCGRAAAGLRQGYGHSVCGPGAQPA